MDDSEWLARLPALLERCVERWSLELGEQLEGGYLAEVRGCTGPDGEDLVLIVSPLTVQVYDDFVAPSHLGADCATEKHGG